MSSITSIPLAVFVFTLALLGWGFYRSRKLGKLGMLSWLQFVALMSPWIVYFGLFITGIFINFALLLLLLLASTSAYIFLGNQLRKGALAEQANLEKVVSQQSNSNIEVKSDNVPPKAPINEDLKAIQGIFGIETFYATETISYQEGAIFKGNLRGDPAEVHARLTHSLRDRLSDKYNLFLVEGQEQKPVVVVLPSKLSQSELTMQQKILVAVLIVANVLTTISLGGQLQQIDLWQKPELFLSALPFLLGIGSILVCRELAQRWMAKKYQVRLSPPFFLPSSQLGSFGAFSRIQSTVPNRRALFDIAIAPAVASGLISLVILGVGLFLTARNLGSIEIPSQVFRFSVLVGTLAKLTLGDALHVDLVAIHPLVVLGWLGSVITALNLMPAGQLDGGRIVQAVYGRKTAGWTTFITLVFLALAALINPLALYWGGIILFLVRDLERPMLNEISDLDNDRDALGLLALFWMLVTLLPMTPSVAETLGIGR